MGNPDVRTVAEMPASELVEMLAKAIACEIRADQDRHTLRVTTSTDGDPFQNKRFAELLFRGS